MSKVGKSSTSLLAGVKAERDHLCRVAGNTVPLYICTEVVQLSNLSKNVQKWYVPKWSCTDLVLTHWGGCSEPLPIS